jgi:hypothetical protein
MNRIKYITAFCLVFSVTSFKPRFKDERKLLVYATINEKNIFVGADLSWLVGECVELKIDTIDASDLEYLRGKIGGKKYFIYRQVYFNNSQLYDLNLQNLYYLQTLRVSKIMLSHLLQMEPPLTFFSDNCINKEEERGRIKGIAEFYNKRQYPSIMPWQKIFIETVEVRDKNDKIVNMELNSIDCYIVKCN